MRLSTLMGNGEEEWLENKSEELNSVVCVKPSLQARCHPGIDERHPGVEKQEREDKAR